MTQSGQGHDPQNSAAGPAREGIVLPANGEPWVPDHQAAPPAGQPWGQPWGPGQQGGQPPAQPQGYDQAPGQGYAPQPQQALPPQGEAFPPPPQGQPPLPPQQPPAAPLPPGGPYGAGQPQPYGGQPQPEPYGQQAPQPQPEPYGQQAQQAPPQPPVSQPQPEPRPFSLEKQAPQPQPYRQQPPQPQPERSGELVRATPQAGAPLPPTEGDADATALISPIADRAGAPLPPQAAAKPESPGESTTMLRVIKPQAQGPGGQAQPMPQPQSQPMPGAAPAGDSEATQLISPVGAGTPAPPPGAPFGIRPGAPEDRPTPAEFEGLFRDGPGAPGAPAAPDATAQLPRFEDPGRPPYGQGHGQQGYGQQGYEQQGYDQPYDQPYDDDRGGRRRVPAAAIIGVVIVALLGVGLGVGWMLSGGSDDDTAKKKDAGTTKPAKEKTQPKPSADPAEAQAKGLDALLGDSGNSRTSVVNAVRNIGSCDNLGGAAKDLRDAAKQRNDLVTRLQQLPVDKIPNHAQLTAALTKAWQSSAAADNHFAAWAGQVGGKKGCHKGKARNTRQYVQGVAASGAATKAKQQAARIWNPIAQQYHLTVRQPTAL